MRVLPDRWYNPRTDHRDRKRLLPYGKHPAKMYVKLALALALVYSDPGETILDPCFGIGTTSVAMLKGRNVVGIELEPHHFRDAHRNVTRLAGLAQSLGHDPDWSVINGDSRLVIPAMGHPAMVTTSPPYEGALADAGDPKAQVERIRRKIESGELKTENPGNIGRRGRWGSGITTDRITTHGYGLDATLTSPAFGEMNAEHAGGTIVQRPGKNGVGWDGSKDEFVYTADATVTSPAYEETLSDAGGRQRALERGEVIDKRGLKDGAGYGVDLALTSPAYEDLASRDRHLEPHALAKGEDGYGRTDPTRHVSGYGKRDGQIGNMKLSDGSYQNAMTEIYARCLEATRDGGAMVLVTGNYIREKELVDLAEITIDLARIAGWTPVERWRALKRTADGKTAVSFWRILGQKKGLPMIDWEDVLVFTKGHRDRPFNPFPR